MVAILLAALVLQSPEPIVRDGYGVPHILAPTVEQAYYYAGYAAAQDRLWQMESSRRLARGRMSEVFGARFVASDREVLASAYTDEEMTSQLAQLAPPARDAIENYAKGVNAWIDEAGKNGKLPKGYADNGFSPERWSVLDTAAIAVRLLQQFGTGGAGEIRDLALFDYIQGRAQLKAHALDVLDDLAPQNDPAATPTVLPSDDPLTKDPPHFPKLTRAITQAHLAMLPKIGLLDLLPALRLAMREESTRVAEMMSVPFKMGSYCVVVSPSRSATGSPILLSGPQMGLRAPSIVHEMSIDAPGLSVVGMDVPGVPGIVVGCTQSLAWGLTSGVADTEDIFYSKADGADGYTVGTEKKPLQTIRMTLKVKGAPDETVVQNRTVYGPVILIAKGPGIIFSRHSAYRMRELRTYDAFYGLYAAKTPDELDAALAKSTMNFNFFYATTTGETGYHYVGDVPVRAEGLDPRFPTPGSPEYDWKGMIPFEKMPHVRNPKGGLIANWNNKPASWWPNMDTPAWGRIFRNSALLGVLEKPKLGTEDVELAAWTIARTDETWPYFKPYVGDAFGGFDGRLIDGSPGAAQYLQFIDLLKSEVFEGTTGNFMSKSTFLQVAQPTVLLRALEKKTAVNYLGSRSAADVVRAALGKVVKTDANGLIRYAARTFPAGAGEPPIPYSNRGTYIQIVDLLAAGPNGRNVVTPGVAESGPHSTDQGPLARAWLYKPMTRRR